MNFKELKSKLFIEAEEIIINKKVNIQGKEILLLSFIKGDESNTLYALYEGHNEIKEEILFEPEAKCEAEEFEDYEEEYIPTTNREEMIDNIKSSNESVDIFLREMTIQNQLVTFESSSAGAVEYYDWSEMVIIQHFIKLGIIPEEFYEVNLENMILLKFQQTEEESFPKINLKEDVEITLEVDERGKEILIQHPFTVKLGQAEKNIKIYYTNEENNEKEYFYLNELKKYDIWKDVEENLDEVLKNIDEEQREEYRSEYISCTEQKCPKNMDLLTIYYETPNNIQLNFFEKEYLEKEVEYSSSILMMCTNCNDEGINGNKKYSDFLTPIEKDFDGEIEMELFSKYIKIPSESITFKI